MAKTNKTVGKTTTSPKKGVDTMTISTALTKFLIEQNKYQEYREKTNKTYSYANKQELAAFAKTLKPEELNKLAQTYLYQQEMGRRFAAFRYREHRLNLAYGKEEKNIMELTDEERELINKRRAAKEASQRKEVK